MKRHPQMIRNIMKYDMERLEMIEGMTTRKVRIFYHYKYGMAGEEVKSRRLVEAISEALGRKNSRNDRTESTFEVTSRAEQTQGIKNKPGSRTDVRMESVVEIIHTEADENARMRNAKEANEVEMQPERVKEQKKPG